MSGPADGRGAARSPWLPPEPGRAEAPLRLYCLPHAGAGPLAFLGWERALAPEIDPVPLCPPGRERRYWDPPYCALPPYVAALADVLREDADRPYALFGHSVGALVAFELARALRATGAPDPVHLFVSGRIAPQLADPRPALHTLPDDALVRELVRFGGLPENALRSPEILDLVLPVLRADLAVNETYRHVPQPPLEIPVTVFGGAADPKVERDELWAWQEQAAGFFEVVQFEGGHFFTRDRREDLLAAIAARLVAVRA